MCESANRDSSEFFVGYLPAPRRLARFVCRLALALVAAFIAISWLISRVQSDPGSGVWDTGVAREFVGRIRATPYPHIRILPARQGDPIETLWLVEIGKFGGGQRAAAFDGRVVRLSGWLLERDGRRMLEMEPGDTIRLERSVGADQISGLDEPRIAPLGRVTLCGEIVDSKCFLGAMKPGEGKTHKECATLCIAGGIPPMFVTLDAFGRRDYYLVTDSEGRGFEGRVLREAVLPHVADAVELTGELELHDGVSVLLIDPKDIHRL